MQYCYEYSTYNSHHKVLVNLQASNMDALKSISQIGVFIFVAIRCTKSSSFSAFIMAAVSNTAGHYTSVLWFLLYGRPME